MNIKDTLRDAVNAHIAGDTEGAAKSIKEAITGRVRALVKEAAPNKYGVVNWWESGVDYFGPYDIQLAEGQVQGLPAGLYEMCVNVDGQMTGHSTPGTFSPQAETPDEFYGETPELEIQIHAVQLCQERDDQAVMELEGQEAADLVSQEIYQKIEQELTDKMQRQADLNNQH